LTKKALIPSKNYKEVRKIAFLHGIHLVILRNIRLIAIMLSLKNSV